MKKDNSLSASFEAPFGRITRARAASCHGNGKVLPSIPSLANPEKKQTQRGNSKRAASDENSNAPFPAASQCKKRAVLKDVTNICSQTSSRKWVPAGKVQRGKSGPPKTKRCSNPQASKSSLAGNANVENKMIEGIQKVEMQESKKYSPLEKAEDSMAALQHEELTLAGNASICDNVENKAIEAVQKAEKLVSLSKEASPLEKVGYSLVALQHKESIRVGERTCMTTFFEGHSFGGYAKNGFVNDAVKLYDDPGEFNGLEFIDIDTDYGNPQMCCTYASEIYTNLHAAELIRRPVSNFMETVQRDITQSMRGILIDWLVEVAEEYRLVPDTLYLTVYIIDKFLSQNYIERQKLQLLGITCMLIASKYEEICAPRVEEFCFITDNTYTKAEVLKMESQVLGYLGFQLSVPTTKTFLRRFLRAAHALNKVATLALGYLANYLAELTLVEYCFIKFLPSAVAASAVFLARWTLDPSTHPWNPTLEYYTSYKAMDLKETVFALQELQMNSKSCPLNAIREKYGQQKFECVATLASPSLEESLFC